MLFLISPVPGTPSTALGFVGEPGKALGFSVSQEGRQLRRAHASALEEADWETAGGGVWPRQSRRAWGG